MIEIAVRDLAEATGARIACGPCERVCRGVAIDSREVPRDGVFVAFPGERVDGASFAPQVVEAGAACVVLADEPSAGLAELAEERSCAVLVAEDATEFLLRAAGWYRDRLDASVVGVTGSVGKTTTKDVLAGLLAQRFRVHATRGNYNNLIGCPLTILSAPADTQVLVLEMGMNHLHEIERLSACARPDLAIITKVGTSHIGILGSRENIARAKAEILAGMGGGASPALILHGEDDFAPFIEDGFAKPAGVEVIRCGSAPTDAVRAADIELGEDGCPCFSIAFAQGPARRVRLSVPGAQSVPNALFAAAAAHRLGLSEEDICAGFGRLGITGRRVQVRPCASGARVIDDSYNASAESMAAGLDLLSSLPCTGSRIAILGEMAELGEEAPRSHALTGAYAAAKKVDLLICVGADMARAMAGAARTMGLDEGDVQVVASVDELIERFGRLLGEGDLALVKASRCMELDRYVEEVCCDAR